MSIRVISQEISFHTGRRRGTNRFGKFDFEAADELNDIRPPRFCGKAFTPLTWPTNVADVSEQISFRLQYGSAQTRGVECISHQGRIAETFFPAISNAVARHSPSFLHVFGLL